MYRNPVLSLFGVLLLVCLNPLVSLAGPKLDFNNIAAFEGFLDLHGNDQVLELIQVFLDHPYDTEQMLARSITYFPMIEKEISERSLPEELKVLPFIESGYDPLVGSVKGAAGLWQFMVPTAREMGLSVTSLIDERKHPVKATKAALNYLQYLYGKYEDWTLAFAAYNAGPGRVNKAIRMAGGERTFDKIKEYLPRETRDYIPKYLAAQYIIERYQEHGLNPTSPDLDMQWTGSVRLEMKISLAEISDVISFCPEKLAMLNPGLNRDYIPSVVGGYDLTLPKRVIPTFEHFLATNETKNLSLSYETAEVPVSQLTSIYDLAEKMDTDPFLIKTWNNLRHAQVSGGDVLIIHHLSDPCLKAEKLARNELLANPFRTLPSRLSARTIMQLVAMDYTIAQREYFDWELHQM